MLAGNAAVACFNTFVVTYRISEVAAPIGVSEDSARRLVAADVLPAHKGRSGCLATTWVWK